MDPIESLMVRFHYGGEFLTVGGHLQYFGGSTGMSAIDVDKLSLPEIEGHLADHMATDGRVQLHWLYPGMGLGEGLRLLHDDNACCEIPKHIGDGGVADIYVEVPAVQYAKDSDWELEFSEADDEQEEIYVDVPSSMPTNVETTPEKQRDKDLFSFRQFYKSPSKCPAEKGKEHASKLEGDSSESSDVDWVPKDLDSSGDDDETQQLRQFAKQIKKDIKCKKTGGGLEAEVDNLEDDGSPYFNSSDEYSYEEGSDGETIRWRSTENRYDSKAHVPMFALGMAFRSSRQFKKALVRYGLTTHRHLLFPKDEKNKVRAICSWKGCKWLIYGSKTSRSE